MHMPSLRFQTTIKTFQMKYCMMYYHKGHQNCQKSKLKLPKKSAFIKQIQKYKSLSSGNFDAPGRKTAYFTSFVSSH